jgi:hypothetical protein
MPLSKSKKHESSCRPLEGFGKLRHRNSEQLELGEKKMLKNSPPPRNSILIKFKALLVEKL